MTLRVWRHDEFTEFDADEREDRAWAPPNQHGVLYPENFRVITDVREAAKLYADYCHARRDGWEWSWPVKFVVDDGAAYVVIEVEREHVPEFRAGNPVPLTIQEAR